MQTHSLHGLNSSPRISPKSKSTEHKNIKLLAVQKTWLIKDLAR